MGFWTLSLALPGPVQEAATIWRMNNNLKILFHGQSRNSAIFTSHLSIHSWNSFIFCLFVYGIVALDYYLQSCLPMLQQSI